MVQMIGVAKCIPAAGADYNEAESFTPEQSAHVCNGTSLKPYAFFTCYNFTCSPTLKAPIRITVRTDDLLPLRDNYECV